MRVRLLVVRVVHVVIEGLERYRSSSKLWGGNGEVERDEERGRGMGRISGSVSGIVQARVGRSGRGEVEGVGGALRETFPGFRFCQIHARGCTSWVGKELTNR